MLRPKFSLPLRRFIHSSLAAASLLGVSRAPVAGASDYLVDAWDTENNLPSRTVTAIAQTPDGYLWAGTYNGLARFDGARFVTFDPANTPALSQARVEGLFLDANGTLWISTYRGGLTSYRAGVFRNEWPDRPAYDLQTTLVSASSNLVTFVTQDGEVLQRDPAATNSPWQVFSPPESRPVFQCVDGANRLWFLNRNGHVLQFAGGKFNLLADDGGLTNHPIYTVAADAGGQIWAGAENEIARWDGSRFLDLTPTNDTAGFQPQMLIPTQGGAVWVLDGDRLRQLAGRAWTTEVLPWRGLLGAASGRAVGAHEDRVGGLWLNHYGNGLFHITPAGVDQRLTTQDGLPGDRVGAWFQSRDGSIWLGMDHGGLARLHSRRFQLVGVNEGLPARPDLSVCEDGQGAIWIGTAGGGLCRWDNGLVTRFQVGSRASANFIFSIAPRPDGGLWLSAAEGEDLFQLTNGQIHRVIGGVHGIKSTLTDHQGRVWWGTKNGVVLLAGGEYRMVGTNSNAASPAVRALAETPDGQVWAGADDGTIYRCEPDKLTAFRPTDKLADEPVYSLTSDANGTLWAGTFRGGLLRFRSGSFSRITAKQGLPADVICQILDDRHGRLWLGTHQGIYSVTKASLHACADGRTNTLDYVAYGRKDGLPTPECSDGYQPACWRGMDGRLWFTTVRGVVSVNPKELTAKSEPPPVRIEELRLDGEPVPLSPSAQFPSSKSDFRLVVVPPGREQLDFRFTALSFEAGDQARFRYRVDGLDKDWVEADTRRILQLRNVPPGDYCLHVIACNGDGVWNDIGASLAFEIQPRLYQTWLFKIILGAVVITGISFAVRRAATRKYRRKLVLLQQQNAIERDRARIAKDIHDDIGAGLTQITLLAELVRRQPEQTAANLERITSSARRLTKAMDEIVWAVDPQHDTFEGLMDYISAYAEDFLRVAGVRCRMDLPLGLPAMRVDAELRYNLFLALKEALNNVVKHAKATEVWLRLKVEADFFTLIVDDDGSGMPATSVGIASDTQTRERQASGSGVANLKKRLATVGGECTVHSAPGRGTCVAMTIRLATGGSPIIAIGGGKAAG